MLSNNHLIDLKNKTVLNECSSQNNSNDLKSKSSKTCCRLIWCCYCCCCRDCYLHVIHNQNNSCSKIFDEIQSDSIPRRIESNNLFGFIENDLVFSLDEVKSWKVSFDNLMNSDVGRNIFRDFLRYEYSEENMAFWLACEEFKKMSIDDPTIEERTKAIYDEFISVLSSREVSLDSKVREIINKDMRSPTLNIFNEAQLQIYTLMQRDSYPRFLNSHIYKSILNEHFNNNDDNVQVVNL